MRYLTEAELRRLAETDELVPRRWNGIWICDRGAIQLPLYFSLVANDIRIRYNKAWHISFSFSTREEFTVRCREYSALTSALYDIGLLVTSWSQDAYFSLKIEPEALDVVYDAIRFISTNADNDEPLPERLIEAIRAYDAPSTLSALWKIQDYRKP